MLSGVEMAKESQGSDRSGKVPTTSIRVPGKTASKINEYCARSRRPQWEVIAIIVDRFAKLPEAEQASLIMPRWPGEPSIEPVDDL